jgi:hypothetical protein
MHQQIRTSPGTTGENLRRALDILARADVNVEGIGPDFEPPHIRIAVRHDQWDQAWKALDEHGLKPEARAAIAFAVPNAPGQVAPILERLARQGYALESFLVLAGQDGDRTLVSVGVRETVPRGWSATIAELGGWEETSGRQGGSESA